MYPILYLTDAFCSVHLRIQSDEYGANFLIHFSFHHFGREFLLCEAEYVICNSEKVMLNYLLDDDKGSFFFGYGLCSLSTLKACGCVCWAVQVEFIWNIWSECLGHFLSVQ